MSLSPVIYVSRRRHLTCGTLLGLVAVAVVLIATLHTACESDSVHRAPPAVVDGKIVIRSCDDLFDRTAFKGTVIFDGYIRCDKTKVVEVAEDAKDVIFKAKGSLHVGGLQFYIRAGAAMYFHGQMLAFERPYGDVEVFDVEGAAYFKAHNPTYMVKPWSMSLGDSNKMICSSPGAIVEFVERSVAYFTINTLVVVMNPVIVGIDPTNSNAVHGVDGDIAGGDFGGDPAVNSAIDFQRQHQDEKQQWEQNKSTKKQEGGHGADNAEKKGGGKKESKLWKWFETLFLQAQPYPDPASIEYHLLYGPWV